MQITETERRDRLIKWLEDIYREVQQLLVNEHLFWELQKIVKENDNFKDASGLFTRWIADGFKNSSMIAVRRQVKLDKHFSPRLFGGNQKVPRTGFTRALYEPLRGKGKVCRPDGRTQL